MGKRNGRVKSKNFRLMIKTISTTCLQPIYINEVPFPLTTLDVKDIMFLRTKTLEYGTRYNIC